MIFKIKNKHHSAFGLPSSSRSCRITLENVIREKKQINKCWEYGNNGTYHKTLSEEWIEKGS